MEQVVLHAAGDVRLDQVDEPEPGPLDAVIRVRACGICGSDLGYIRQGGLPLGARGPMRLGHELSGVVEAVGREVRGLSSGQRVALDPTHEGIGNGGPEGGFTRRLLVRNAGLGGRLFPVPDALPLDLAALAEPLGVGMHAVDRAQVGRADRVVVVGAGPIGLAAIATLRDRGVEDVVAFDLSPRRRELACKLGARESLDAGQPDVWESLHALHGSASHYGRRSAGSDVYIEASGAPSVIPAILESAKRGARISVVAIHHQSVPVSFLDVLVKELSILGAIEYPPDFGAMLRLLERWDLSEMITHRFPLSRFPDALAAARDQAAAGKVLVEMDGAG
jgi:threonine dehydrogenase-like Zn-dependent dehydrogenase